MMKKYLLVFLFSLTLVNYIDCSQHNKLVRKEEIIEKSENIENKEESELEKMYFMVINSLHRIEDKDVLRYYYMYEESEKKVELVLKKLNDNDFKLLSKTFRDSVAYKLVEHFTNFDDLIFMGKLDSNRDIKKWIIIELKARNILPKSEIKN